MLAEIQGGIILRFDEMLVRACPFVSKSVCQCLMSKNSELLGTVCCAIRGHQRKFSARAINNGLRVASRMVYRGPKWLRLSFYSYGIGIRNGNECN